ncbi:MAG: efflux RND transporter periplasmic adaptor subunit [Porticoccaceae bacterium]|nr:efflux RND transporter periplasmic adaptor subunit [Porticoccaceae bacterium]
MKHCRFFCLLTISTIALSACSPNKDSAVEEHPLRLETALVSSETLALEYTVVGNVISDHRVDISSKIAAYIRTINVVEGEHIRSDQVLATLDDSAISNAIAQARAALGSAKAQLDDASADLTRYQNLLKDESVAESRVQKTRLLRDTAKEQFNSATAALNSALAQRQYTQITSPVNGLVIARHQRSGDLTTPGAPILSVESQQGLLFQTYLPERYLSRVKPGDKLAVHLDTLPAPLSGKVLRIVPSADPITRRVEVNIAFLPNEASNPGGSPIPGMFGRVSFLLGSDSRPVIPNSALFERGGLQGVFVIDDNNRLRFRWLRIGRQYAGTTEIVAGLSAGERILTTAQPGLSEGALIEDLGMLEKPGNPGLKRPGNAGGVTDSTER